MLYYKSSRILTWYDQYLPPAQGSQEGWESGGGGECYGLDDLIGPLKLMYQISNSPTREKSNTISCYLPPCLRYVNYLHQHRWLYIRLFGGIKFTINFSEGVFAMGLCQISAKC